MDRFYYNLIISKYAMPFCLISEMIYPGQYPGIFFYYMPPTPNKIWEEKD